MKPVLEILEQRLSDTLRKVTGLANCPAMVRQTADAKFGDYQANGIMGAAKQIKTNPRQVAEQVVAALELSDICDKPEIAGPGFINLRLTTEFLSRSLMEMHQDDRLGIEKAANPQTVVVDYSGPNIAKQMHVGHLRSTIIGDCIARMLDSLGHNVIRQNHVGDWGLQMGMLLAIVEQYNANAAELQGKNKNGTLYVPSLTTLEEIENLYKNAASCFAEDEIFAEKARSWTVRLQKHDLIAKEQWRIFCKLTFNACNEIYKTLNVGLTDKDVRGESFYDNKLMAVVKDLQDKNLAVESEGAVCVFPEGFKTKEGEPLPFIIQKSDGAYLYATTDLAAMRFRLKDLGAKRIIYVTDARQTLHFKMLFAVVKMAGWADDSVKLEHITFGTMLGADNKPFKTRTGGTVKLAELLDEAVERAMKVVEEKNPDLPTEQKKEIANAVGVGAVKYSDYSNNRDSDYIFSFDKMLAMDGNTAPYMQYAYARIKSIGRKAAQNGLDVKNEIQSIRQITLFDPAEIELARHLVRYGQAIVNAAADCRPNYLTSYLYDLSGAFSRFYNACPVLGAEGQIRSIRLLLCDITARTIRHGMTELLGIEVPEQM
jgi:arginyl-tRNA synthetase